MLPAPAALINGIRTFSVTLKTAGPQTVTATAVMVPPARLALSTTVCMANRTSARNDAPMPLWATVAPSLMVVPPTPTSVVPPLRPAAHARSAGPAAAAAPADFELAGPDPVAPDRAADPEGPPAATDPSQVSASYLSSLANAATLLDAEPTPLLIADITDELEAKALWLVEVELNRTELPFAAELDIFR